jgi:hypothetical protein
MTGGSLLLACILLLSPVLAPAQGSAAKKTPRWAQVSRPRLRFGRLLSNFFRAKLVAARLSGIQNKPTTRSQATWLNNVAA